MRSQTQKICRRILQLALLISITLTLSASIASAYQRDWPQQAKLAAETYWHNNSEWTDHCAAKRVAILESSEHAGPRTYARTITGDCHNFKYPFITLTPRAYQQQWPLFCTIVIHEWGHLIGHKHVDSPSAVMYPVVGVHNTQIAFCNRFRPPSATRLARQWSLTNLTLVWTADPSASAG